MTKRWVLVISVFVFVLAMARPAHAYLDAGTGSMVLQLLLGGIAGLAVIVKLSWHRLTGRFTSNGEKTASGAGDEDDPT